MSIACEQQHPLELNLASDSDASDFGAGFGLGLGFVAAGVVCLRAPEYLGASPGWTTVWYAIGAIAGLIGIAGAAIELEKLAGSDSGFGYIGAALFVAGLGGIAHLVQARQVLSGSAASGARLVALILVLFSLTGLGMGVGQLVSNLGDSTMEDRRGAVRKLVLSGIIAVFGLGTAVLNFLAAGA